MKTLNAVRPGLDRRHAPCQTSRSRCASLVRHCRRARVGAVHVRRRGRSPLASSAARPTNLVCSVPHAQVRGAAMGSFVELVLQAILVAGTTAIFALIGWVPVMVVSGARDQSGCVVASPTSIQHTSSSLYIVVRAMCVALAKHRATTSGHPPLRSPFRAALHDRFIK